MPDHVRMLISIPPRYAVSQVIGFLKGKSAVFGQIKERRGFRRFSLRGLNQVRCEWKLVCTASNLLKLYGSGWIPQAA